MIDLNPASSSFTTTAMVPVVLDGIIASWADSLVNNTGFNYMGWTNKYFHCRGTKNVSIASSATVTFSTDTAEGGSSFSSGSSYMVFAMPYQFNSITPAGADQGVMLRIERVDATQFKIHAQAITGTAGGGATIASGGTVDVYWLAIGY